MEIYANYSESALSHARFSSQFISLNNNSEYFCLLFTKLDLIYKNHT